MAFLFSSCTKHPLAPTVRIDEQLQQPLRLLLIGGQPPCDKKSKDDDITKQH